MEDKIEFNHLYDLEWQKVIIEGKIRNIQSSAYPSGRVIKWHLLKLQESGSLKHIN